MRRKSIPLFVEWQGRRVVSGRLGRDGIFRKSVETRQKLFVLDAYGIDEANVNELKALGCRAIELRERDTGRIYRIDFSRFVEKAVPRQIGMFGVRYYLPLRYWQTTEQAAEGSGR